jgi:dolichyl-phosphate-mannose-protein mannosyltransferase
MQVLEGLGPQETRETYEYGYDHPFFGQIFLAATLSLINYPDSLSPSINLHSIEMLYLVPRLLMGILAVIDTFLVYKIAETRYNRNIAFFSAILFAVMPLSHILRGILLDSIELPFILLSILFAVYYSKAAGKIEITTNSNSIDKNILLVLLSGIFLGLAIFTKVPVIMMIPLLAFIILEKHMSVIKAKITITRHLKTLVIWFIPVILIALLWPGYAILVGQFHDWIDGVLYQTGRQGNTNLLYSINIVTQLDPVLVILGIVSTIYAAIKKDFFALIWMLPYLIFLYLIGWVVYFHWSVFLPVLCIASAILVERLREKFAGHKFIRLFPFIMISGIVIFGLLSFGLLSMSNLNTTYTSIYLIVTQELDHKDAITDHEREGDKIGTTLIGGHRIRALVWIPKYVFDNAVTFRDTDLPNDNFTKPIQSAKFLVVADSNLLAKFAQINPQVKYSTIASLYYNTSQTIATFIDEEEFKNNLLNIRENHGFGPFIEIRANY